MSDDYSSDEIDRIISDLYTTLNIEERADVSSGPASLSSCFLTPSRIPKAQLDKVGLDLSLLCGASGDWNLALEFLVSLNARSTSFFDQALKAWEIRCLIELGRYSEALAVVRAYRWDEKRQLHVNFLAGKAFYALGMGAEAQQRFDAVHRKNPNYPGVAQFLDKD